MKIRRMWLGAVVVAGLAVVPSIAVAANRPLTPRGSRQVWVTSNCKREVHAPKTIVLTCGDGLTWLQDMRWVTWTTRGATGIGKLSMDNCKPFCAAGKRVTYRVAVTLSKPKRCRRQAHETFSHAELSFPGNHPRPAVKSWTISCPI